MQPDIQMTIISALASSLCGDRIQDTSGVGIPINGGIEYTGRVRRFKIWVIPFFGSGLDLFPARSRDVGRFRKGSK